MNRFAFFALAALSGAVVGVLILVLIQLILWVQWIGFGEASEARYAAIVATQPAWRIILVPAIGGLIVGLLVQRVPGKRYHGIADVMEACALNSARMPTRSDWFAAAAAAVSLGSGAPLGREGPAVHIGASLSAWLAERLNLDRSQSLALLGCGAAAAVTVSFNAPVAAVIFALEVIVGYYTLRVFAPIMVACVAAVVVRHLALDDQLFFALPDYELASFPELLVFVVIGVFGAAVVYMVIGVAHASRRCWERVAIPSWLRPMFAGIVFGVVALELPMVLSVGFEATDAALRGEMTADIVLPLLVAKLLLVGLAIGSGCAGGVFGPAVFLGALLGAGCWSLIHTLGVSAAGLLPDAISQQGVYALVGTAAVASAMLGAPISTVLIVFEMTGDYDITVAVLVAAAVSTTVMQAGPWGSFFRWQLSNRSINITTGRDISLLMTHQVADLISDRYSVSNVSAEPLNLQAQMGRERQRIAVLVDDEGRFTGSVTLAALLAHWHAMDELNRQEKQEQQNQQSTESADSATQNDDTMEEVKVTPASDKAEAVEESDSTEEVVHALELCMAPKDVAVGSATNIVNALNLMADRQLDYLPVVDDLNTDEPKIKGVLLKNDLLTAHYDVVKKARQDEFGIS